MFKIEKRFLEWVEKHILLFCVIGVTLISMIIRYSFREIISNDAYWCLLPWYDVIKENGGIYALGSQVGDYNMLYQFLIAIFSTRSMRFIGYLRICLCNVPLHRKKKLRGNETESSISRLWKVESAFEAQEAPPKRTR